MTEVQYSDDGYWWWDEAAQQWQPVEASTPTGAAEASTDQSSTDQASTDWSSTDQASTDWSSTDQASTDWSSPDQASTEWPGTEAATEPSPAETEDSAGPLAALSESEATGYLQQALDAGMSEVYEA